MNKKNKFVMNASLLRTLLAVSILLVVAIGTLGFNYGLGLIKTYAIEVGHKKVDAQASNGNIQALQRIQKELNENNDILKKIDLLKSNSQFPEFRIVDEVRTIATNNNISIDSFTYADAAASTTTPATGTTTPPIASTAPVTGAMGNTISLSVTLKAPIAYASLLQFTYDIEQNLPKMRIKGISVSTGSGGTATTGQPATSSSGQISVEPITIEMYIN